MKLKDALNIVFERVIGPNTVDSSDMEGMGGGGVLIEQVEMGENKLTITSHTCREILEELKTGIVFIRHTNDESGELLTLIALNVSFEGDAYQLETAGSGAVTFTATGLDDYFIANLGGGGGQPTAS